MRIMKKVFFLFVFMTLFFTSANAQDYNSKVNINDVFLVGKVDSNNYKHINFPRANFIIKKGGIANFKNVVGEKVKIISIKEKKDGTKIATIALESGKKFFNSHKYVTVDIDAAIENKELIK